MVLLVSKQNNKSHDWWIVQELNIPFNEISIYWQFCSGNITSVVLRGCRNTRCCHFKQEELSPLFQELFRVGGGSYSITINKFPPKPVFKDNGWTGFVCKSKNTGSILWLLNVRLWKRPYSMFFFGWGISRNICICWKLAEWGCENDMILFSNEMCFL